MDSGNPQPLRQAFALAYAMQRRPTKALASKYFEALKRVLDPQDDKGGMGNERGTISTKPRAVS